MVSVGDNVRKLKPSYISGGNVKWYNSFEKQWHFFKKNEHRPGVVAYFCNFSCSGGRDCGNRGLRPAWAKNRKTPSQPIKLNVVDHVYHPSYVRDVSRIVEKANLGKTTKPCSKKMPIAERA
jgi:hypothetical protein